MKDKLKSSVKRKRQIKRTLRRAYCRTPKARTNLTPVDSRCCRIKKARTTKAKSRRNKIKNSRKLKSLSHKIIQPITSKTETSVVKKGIILEYKTTQGKLILRNGILCRGSEDKTDFPVLNSIKFFPDNYAKGEPLLYYKERGEINIEKPTNIDVFVHDNDYHSCDEENSELDSEQPNNDQTTHKNTSRHDFIRSTVEYSLLPQLLKEASLRSVRSKVYFQKNTNGSLSANENFQPYKLYENKSKLNNEVEERRKSQISEHFGKGRLNLMYGKNRHFNDLHLDSEIILRDQDTFSYNRIRAESGISQRYQNSFSYKGANSEQLEHFSPNVFYVNDLSEIVSPDSAPKLSTGENSFEVIQNQCQTLNFIKWNKNDIDCNLNAGNTVYVPNQKEEDFCLRRLFLEEDCPENYAHKSDEVIHSSKHNAQNAKVLNLENPSTATSCSSLNIAANQSNDKGVESLHSIENIFQVSELNATNPLNSSEKNMAEISRQAIVKKDYSNIPKFNYTTEQVPSKSNSAAHNQLLAPLQILQSEDNQSENKDSARHRFLGIQKPKNHPFKVVNLPLSAENDQKRVYPCINQPKNRDTFHLYSQNLKQNSATYYRPFSFIESPFRQSKSYSRVKRYTSRDAEGHAINVEKLFDYHQKQYVKTKSKPLKVQYSGRFLTRYIDSNIEKEIAFKVNGSKNLLIADSGKFIARIEVRNEIELDFHKSFTHNKLILLKNICITKILEDELLSQRNKTYRDFKEALGNISQTTAENVDHLEDILQLFLIVESIKDWETPTTLSILEEINNNQYISDDLRSKIDHILCLENRLLNRNANLPAFRTSAISLECDIFELLQNILETGIGNHRRNLLQEIPKQNLRLLGQILGINKLPPKELLFLNNRDIKLFLDIDAITNEESRISDLIAPLKFIDNLWDRFYKRFEHVTAIHRSLKSIGPLTHSIYSYLLKSFWEVILNISDIANMTIDNLFIKENGEFDIADCIEWPTNSPFHKSLEQQYRLLFELMVHFEPGKYSIESKFSYKFKLHEMGNESFWQRLKNKLFNSQKQIDLPNERLAWIYILDCGLAPILTNDSNEHFKKLLYSLLTVYTKFIEEAEHDRYESFRFTTQNIIKFAAQVSPYFSTVNSVTSHIDHSILDQQTEIISDMLISEDADLISNHFTNLMDIYNEYWKNREYIVGNIFKKCNCNEFIKDMSSIAINLLKIVDKSLSIRVDLKQVINFLRSYNEFLKHFKGIKFEWLVPGNSFDSSHVSPETATIKDTKSQLFIIHREDEFVEVLKRTKQKIPKHSSIVTVNKLLETVELVFEKQDWSKCDRLKAVSDMFLAVGHSFIHFKDQVKYTDLDNFSRDCTLPFHNVINNSATYTDFKIRLNNVENFYIYSRKIDEIGIKKAFLLMENEAKNSRDGVFDGTINSDLLEACYNRYYEKFVSLFDVSIPEILTDIREQLQSIDVMPTDQWTPHFKQNVVPLLLADLAAIWTLLESKDIASLGEKIKPHCIQVLCILRLLGADSESNGIDKHFAQVLTGQGKSIILGLTSAILALTGNEVCSICYSRYLANRDQNAFDSFFKILDDFKVKDKVSYMKFEDLISRAFQFSVNGVIEHADVLVRKLLFDKLEKEPCVELRGLESAVLLIDEADVLFSDKYYGHYCSRIARVQMPALLEIQPRLWEIVDSGIYETDIVLEKINEFIYELLKDDKYVVLEKYLLDLNEIFKKELNKMVDSAITISKTKTSASLKNKPKLDKDGFISLPDKFGIYHSRLYYDYDVVFSYFRLKISHYDPKNYNNYGYIVAPMGDISYANIPKAFPLILGVSGTLDSLNFSEKDAIQRYGINKISLMPSFFGDRKLLFHPQQHFTIEDCEDRWTTKIFSHVNNKIKLGRAVTVFFETVDKLNLFEEKYRSNINRLHTLTGNEEPNVLEWRIKEAGVAQTVTLATRNMGRGIDFQSNDLTVEANGGVHVIQTFFSLEETEEIQIQGRTARKKNEGSYELIICKDHILKFRDIIANTDSSLAYLKLCRERKAISEVSASSYCKWVKDADIRHTLTIEFYKSLSNYTPEKRNEYFSRYPFVPYKTKN